MTTGNDLLFGNAAPAMSFDVRESKTDQRWVGPNHTIRGVVAEFGSSHRRELINEKGSYRQGELLYWQADRKMGTNETERPVMDPVLTVQTSFSDWEGTSATAAKVGTDDGRRRVFITGRAKTSPGSLLDAVRSACIAKGVRKIEPGMFVTITCTTVGTPANRNLNPPKIYEAEVWPMGERPEWADELGSDEETAPPEDDDNPFGV